MESNGYEHQLFEAIKSLSTIARRAYWQNHEHCGADLLPACTDCRHYIICKAMDDLDEAMSKLTDWSC